MNDSPVPYSVRLPIDMRDTLKKVAKNNGRSLHAEILLRLEQSLDKTPEKDLMAKIDLSSPEYKKILKAAIKEVIREEREDNQANN